MDSIEEQLAAHALSKPDKVALICGEVEVTYAQLWSRVFFTAQELQTKYNVCKNDRVILSASGCIEFIYVYFGVHIAGGIAVPIDPDTNLARFEFIRQSTNPKCVIGLLHKAGVEGVPFEDVATSEGTSFDYVDLDLDDIADILFTTGTTGDPKGVTLSHRNLSAAAKHINAFIGNTADDVELLALPVSHSFGLGRIRCVLSAGGTLVVLGSFANVKKFFKEMKEHNVTGFGMVPASWAFIKKFSGKYITKFADQLKYVEIGSSFMPVEEKQLLMELLPNTRLNMHYGLTEASRSAFMEFHAEKDNLTTVGKASPNVDIALFDAEGKKVALGEEGEVCVKGAHVCSGYWNEPVERFQKDFFDGYFRTGDCATMDEKGYIYLKSRIKEMINVGGKKVSPMEVEDVLNSIPGIAESACIGIPDPAGMMGEVVKAFIVCSDENLTDKDITTALSPKLEVYKLPVQIERIESIPKTSNGKIQRLKLKT